METVGFSIDHGQDWIDLWNYFLEGFSWFCILGGAFFTFTGAVGMLRMPDFYTRLHAASLSDSMGAPLMFIGFAIQEGWTLTTAKIGLLIFFLMMTSPVATHALGKAALLSGLTPKGKMKD
ncbi:MAG: monovalent cation/H(+) antiporter subunit [Rickettsiales bacterium]|jgi:multicomponent Na+:H+ antiporter subunit G|nr:monovalent cation/H(+) antiporter subunit [Rickettsiales bacterium]